MNPSSPPVAVPISLAACHAAWRRARRGKKPSANRLGCEALWLDRLMDLHTALSSGHWQPARTVSFVVTHPKTREIHAPDFADRKVYRILVERLEKLFEPAFIHDSYANRMGNGSHAAVARLQSFMRQRENMPRQSPACGWYLQLDIHNYFNSIHRPTLYAMLCQRLEQAQARGQLPAAHALALRSLCHKLLWHKVPERVCDPASSAQVPPHKRLCNAAPGCGLPMGNLSSQFFADVYLNALDQFVKHTLKVPHCLRYVDDFVLLGSSPAQLQGWQAQIEQFLGQTLGLKVQHAPLVQPCSQGIDFLGYRVFAQHRRVSPRVVRHCQAKLAQWRQGHLRFDALRSADVAKLEALLGSYWGHFAHANSVRLRHLVFERNPWLGDHFTLLADGGLQPNQPARWHLLRRRAVRQILKPTFVKDPGESE